MGVAAAEVEALRPARQPAIRTDRLTSGLHLSGMLVLLVLGVATVLRFYDLAAWPPFVDEGSYAGTAMQIKDLPLWNAALMATGLSWKPPLAMLIHAWLTTMLGDEIVAGRVLPAAAGVITTGLAGLLARRVAGRAAGILAALLYAVAPVAVLHDRQILQDGPLTMCGLGVMLLTWSAVERSSVRAALATAVVAAIAIELKVTALLLTPLIFTIVGTVWWTQRGSRPWFSLRALIVAAIVLSSPLLSYVALMLSPLGTTLSSQNGALLAPFVAFDGHMALMADTFETYFPGALPLLMVVGLGLLAWRSPASAVVMLAGVVVWTIPLMIVSVQFLSSYAEPIMPICCVLAAVALSELGGLAARWGRPVQAVIGVLIALQIGQAAVASWRLVTDFDDAALSSMDDRSFRGAGSGYGYRDAAILIRQIAEPDAAVGYAIGHPMFRSVALYYHPLPDGMLSLGVIDAEDPLPDLPRPIYVMVGSQIRNGDADTGIEDRAFEAVHPRARIVKHFSRPQSEDGVTVYRIPAAEVKAKQVPVPLRWNWMELAQGWQAVEWHGASWERSSPGENLARFGLEQAGQITLTGGLLSPAAPVEVDIIVDGRVLQTASAPEMSEAAFRATSDSLAAGPHELMLRAHAPGAAAPAGSALPLTVRDLSVTLNPRSDGGKSRD